MDGVSIAANIVGIATAGVALSIKLVTLGTQISTASERVSSIGNDISLTSGILHQLGELMTQKTTENGISVFSQGGLETTRNSAAMCERIFAEVEIELRRASEQIRGCKRVSGGRIKLSRTEKAKWPFLQPSIDLLRADLREAKGTLMLMLQVASLALSKRMADLNQSASFNSEQRDFMRAIVALHQQQTGDERLLGKPSAQSENNAFSFSTAMADSSSLDALSSGADKASAPLYPQPPALPERTKARTRVVQPVARSEDHPAQTSDTPSHPMTSTSRSLSHACSPDTSLAACSTTDLSKFSENSRTAWSEGPKDYQQPSRNAGESIDEFDTNREFSKELSLFLIKPIVRDFFDKVELSWSAQDTKLKGPAIHKYLQKNEEDGLPSVLDMLEKLHDHEQAMVDAELSKTSFGSEGALLSLKRTMTDMRHRDMTFRDVPGLQFVIERQVPPAEPRVVEMRSEMLGVMQRVPVDPRSHRRQRESWVEGPFTGLEDCVVVRDGMVEDRQGNTVGVVVDGDPRRLVGCTVSEHGVIIDRYGTVKGHAEPHEAPEEEVTDPTLRYGDGKGVFWDEDGEVIQQDELLPSRRIQAVEGPFASWETQPQKMAAVPCSEEKPRPDWADDESDMVEESAEMHIHPATAENPLARRGQVDEMEGGPPLLRSSAYPFLELDAASNTVQPYNDVQAASQTADEKRKRNAAAADRFRQRRREKEREASERISKLEEQLREKEELLRRESVQSTGVYSESLSAEVNSESDDDEDREADQGVEDALVAALLQRYTTVFT